MEANIAALLWSSVVTLLLALPETSEAQPVVASLSADGTRVPGGYAVPIGGDITFTCAHNGSSSRSLYWETVIIVNGTATTIRTTALLLGDEPSFSISATRNVDNPVNITIHNLQLANNGSTVTCQLEKEGSPSAIIVEGLPSCAVVNIASRMDSAVTATLTPSSIPWFLPVHFNITVTSSNFQIQTISSETNININIAPIQTTMAYNISVIPCNSFGCNEGCQQYSMILPTEDKPSADSNTTNSGSVVNSFNAIIGVASSGILLIVLTVWVIKWTRDKTHVNSASIEQRATLIQIPEESQEDTPESDPPPIKKRNATQTIGTRSRTGAYTRPPSRLT